MAWRWLFYAVQVSLHLNGLFCGGDYFYAVQVSLHLNGLLEEVAILCSAGIAASEWPA